ncbi:MAG: hypothetical protein ACFUZC_20530 [Chthoniobacteraceae bacterium]
MSLKAIFWVCGATVTATGAILGFRNVARAVGSAYGESYTTSHPIHPDDQHHPQISDDPFSPDAFRDELLK